MNAVVIKDVDHVTIEKKTVPKIRSDEILIKVKMAGICGSDIHTYKGLHPFRKPPVLIGHEVSGEVVDLGSSVSDYELGDKVTVEPQLGCGECEYCKEHMQNLCTSRQAPGVGEWDGTMAEYFKAPASCVMKLPECISHEVGVLAEPLAVAIHAVNKANIRPGEEVAILGGGSIGLLTLAVAHDKGAQQLLVTDVLDYPLNLSEQLGASYTINVTNHSSWPEAAIKKTDGLFDKVIVTNNADNIINEALSITKKAGKIVTVAMFEQNQNVNIHNLQNTEKEIIGCMTYNHEDFLGAIRFIQKDQIPIKNIVSHNLPYHQAPQAFRLVDRKEDKSLKVLLHF
ncbi:zinc-binding dehydrogenase [Thalassobacillus sp. CUG 92003]|uniref:zinc-dependent alcohol dehydrogenase n=1 Tax=Thalassobacillus sp. CUG 92003 TaxID=2736641 RepID=UPI0015E6B3CD|nr:alcohol dehydrogenase catalytic domain-containing protein [Thalassobacillus sp. CUG 92003]